MSTTFDVIPVIEQGLDGLQDTHEVQLALIPNAQHQLVRAIARAVLVAQSNGKPMHSLLLAAGTTVINSDQNDALDTVIAAIGSGWASLTVSPDEATALGDALLDAAEAPPICADCNRVIDSDMSGNVCARCTETPRGRRIA